MLTANRDYFCMHNCYIIVLRQSCQIILPRTYITAVNDGVLRALIDKKARFDMINFKFFMTFLIKNNFNNSNIIKILS